MHFTGYPELSTMKGLIISSGYEQVDKGPGDENTLRICLGLMENKIGMDGGIGKTIAGFLLSAKQDKD